MSESTRTPRRPCRLLGLVPLVLASCASVRERDPAAQAVTPPEGGQLLVDRTLRVAPGEYLRAPLGPAGEAGVIRIERRRGIVLDLEDVILRGQPADAPREQARGWGLRLSGCRDITIRGGKFVGYLAGIVIEDCRDVLIEGVRFEDLYSDRLRSTVATADPADLLVPWTRRATDWLDRYGAAIAVVGGEGVTVRGCTARRGQNGVLLIGARDCEVTGNDFSFLSGWGVALSRAQDCRVVGNRVDYCARGYYGDVYAEGFNAAGLLVAEGCRNNTVAWNSATRCGFGLLVAGRADADEQDRVASNRYVGNDLSWAVAHGALLFGDRDEWFVRNRIEGSLGAGVRVIDADGVVLWGTEVVGVPSAAFLLESTRASLLLENEARRCDRGFEIRPAPSRSGVDAPSFGHWLLRNHVSEALQDVVLEDTEGLVFAENTWRNSSGDRRLEALVGQGAQGLDVDDVWAWLAGPDGALPTGRAARCSFRLIAAERHPWRRDVLRFESPQKPHLVPGRRPEEPSGLSGLVVGEYGPWDFGGDRPRPSARLPGGLLAGATWRARWFRWDVGSDPRGDVETWRALAERPLLSREVAHWLDPFGAAGVREVVGEERFGLLARTTFLVPQSDTYRLSVRSDDGLRLRIDGEVVFEDWTWHPARLETRDVALAAGRHEVELEYFQVDGAAALTIDLDYLPPRELADPAPEAAVLGRRADG